MIEIMVPNWSEEEKEKSTVKTYVQAYAKELRSSYTSLQAKDMSPRTQQMEKEKAMLRAAITEIWSNIQDLSLIQEEYDLPTGTSPDTNSRSVREKAC